MDRLLLSLRIALVAEFCLVWAAKLFVAGEPSQGGFPAHLKAHAAWLAQQPYSEQLPGILYGVAIVYALLQLGLFFGRSICVWPYVFMQFVGLYLVICYGPHVQSGLEQALWSLSWLACGWVLAIILLTDLLKTEQPAAVSDEAVGDEIEAG